jgi:transcriptional regulator with PAS, ATPase and Fis domain
VKNKIDFFRNIADNADKNINIIGSCSLIEECRINALKIAKSDAPVLITGSTGTGKEIFADFIYQNSIRSNKPFIKINCAAIPESLIGTELFGHIKGAFTDAVADRKGKFLSADTGTIFLDEICELPLNIQSRLLRVIESSTVDMIGSDKPQKIDIRIISATNRNIENEISSGNFRKDLYYRINVLSLHIPDLKERKDDIPELLEYFIKMSDKNIIFDESALNRLKSYNWPGNIRELQNYISRIITTFSGAVVKAENIDIEIVENNFLLPLKKAINIYKKNYIIKALNENNWNQSRTALALDIQRTYLSRLINELEIKEKCKE